ncbi:hypothetical protein GCM10010305_33050 [Streptomyces termitum]|uniref:Uncharacterized protein n=1 Tax=Streptomyces termitum TaxID=67368 RepID=A0A918T5Z5_9ACTN|nr:hypothetical protein GCM10010305_33050 [Streptomyces termitum]
MPAAGADAEADTGTRGGAAARAARGVESTSSIAAEPAAAWRRADVTIIQPP